MSSLLEHSRFTTNFAEEVICLQATKEESLPGAHLLHQQVFKQCTFDRHCVLSLDPAMPAMVSQVLTIKNSVVTAGLSN